MLHLPSIPELLRPWLHMISVQSKVTEQDRQKFKWNSSGVVKKTIKKVKGKKDHVNVSLSIIGFSLEQSYKHAILFS